MAFERRAKREAARNDDVSDEEISDTELKKEEAKAVQVSIKSGESVKNPLAGGNGRAGAGLFAPLRAEEGEEWKPIRHYHANVRFSFLQPQSSASDEIEEMYRRKLRTRRSIRCLSRRRRERN